MYSRQFATKLRCGLGTAILLLSLGTLSCQSEKPDKPTATTNQPTEAPAIPPPDDVAEATPVEVDPVAPEPTVEANDAPDAAEVAQAPEISEPKQSETSKTTEVDKASNRGPLQPSYSTRVPAQLQAALFGQILRFVETLAEPRLPVIFVTARKAGVLPDLLAQAFENIGIATEVVEITAIENKLESGAVVYLLPDAATDQVRKLLAKYKVLSITGFSFLVEDGKASIGVKVGADNKPKIVVNAQRLQNEGHSLSPKLAMLVQNVP